MAYRRAEGFYPDAPNMDRMTGGRNRQHDNEVVLGAVEQVKLVKKIKESDDSNERVKKYIVDSGLREARDARLADEQRKLGDRHAELEDYAAYELEDETGATNLSRDYDDIVIETGGDDHVPYHSKHGQKTASVDSTTELKNLLSDLKEVKKNRAAMESAVDMKAGHEALSLDRLPYHNALAHAQEVQRHKNEWEEVERHRAMWQAEEQRLQDEKQESARKDAAAVYNILVGIVATENKIQELQGKNFFSKLFNRGQIRDLTLQKANLNQQLDTLATQRKINKGQLDKIKLRVASDIANKEENETILSRLRQGQDLLVPATVLASLMGVLALGQVETKKPGADAAVQQRAVSRTDFRGHAELNVDNVIDTQKSAAVPVNRVSASRTGHIPSHGRVNIGGQSVRYRMRGPAAPAEASSAGVVSAEKRGSTWTNKYYDDVKVGDRLPPDLLSDDSRQQFK